jgi:hypothetical protein
MRLLFLNLSIHHRQLFNRGAGLYGSFIATIMEPLRGIRIPWEPVTVTREISQFVNQSISQSVNQSIRQSVNQSISQSVNQSIRQSINSSIRQFVNSSIRQFFSS